MPLTKLQKEIARLLATNRTPDSHLAGGAALHFLPNSVRYSDDLDFFHDSTERLAQAFAQDRTLLEKHGYQVQVDKQFPTFVRARVIKGEDQTKIEWVHDSAWRFMPPLYHPDTGYQLHPIDLATNKVLALAGRDEARDLLDTLLIHKKMLPLGALCWAASGKDPGFTPLSLLELLKRKGRYRPEDFSKTHFNQPIDLVKIKGEWLQALEEAEAFINAMPMGEFGCLYYSKSQKRFVAPNLLDSAESGDVVPHFGSPGGILPTIFDGDLLAEQIIDFKPGK